MFVCFLVNKKVSETKFPKPEILSIATSSSPWFTRNPCAIESTSCLGNLVSETPTGKQLPGGGKDPPRFELGT